MQNRISIFSFFSGIGILDLAFERNGYNIVFVNEYDSFFLESYQYARTQMNQRDPLYGYHNDSAERYARRRGKRNLLALIAQEREKGNLVGFIGGPPCPDFSVAGKNAGVDGENGRLTKIYFDIICRCHPDFFLFENVKGLVKTEKHRAFYKEMMMKVQAKSLRIYTDFSADTQALFSGDIGQAAPEHAVVCIIDNYLSGSNRAKEVIQVISDGNTGMRRNIIGSIFSSKEMYEEITDL